MKHYVLLGICLFLFSAVAKAETMYINDILTITVRTGPDIKHKIIAMVQSGELVTVLKSEKHWTQIKLRSGKEGWVLNRFLSATKPNRLISKELKEKYEALNIKLKPIIEENNKLKEENKSLNSELNSKTLELEKLNKSYSTLKKDAAEFLELKSKYQKTNSNFTKLTKQYEKTKSELSQLLTSRSIRWFLSGAGVLFVGFILGFSTKRQRRTSSLL